MLRVLCTRIRSGRRPTRPSAEPSPRRLGAGRGRGAFRNWGVLMAGCAARGPACAPAPRSNPQNKPPPHREPKPPPPPKTPQDPHPNPTILHRDSSSVAAPVVGVAEVLSYSSGRCIGAHAPPCRRAAVFRMQPGVRSGANAALRARRPEGCSWWHATNCASSPSVASACTKTPSPGAASEARSQRPGPSPVRLPRRVPLPPTPPPPPQEREIQIHRGSGLRAALPRVLGCIAFLGRSVEFCSAPSGTTREARHRVRVVVGQLQTAYPSQGGRCGLGRSHVARAGSQVEG